MANTTLTADIIAKIALPILENELGWLSSIYRAHEEEFSKKVNGYAVGDTISIRRPADFTIRSGAVMDVQDVIEGKVSLTVDQQKGVDFKFSSTDLTLKVEDLGERVIRPAMSALVNDIGRDVLGEFYYGVYNWAGTAGQTINSFADFYKGPERLNEMAVPMDERHAVLSPADHAGMLGSLTGLFIESDARAAFRRGTLGPIGGATTWMSQVVPTHTNGTADNTTPKVDGAQSTTYDSVKNTWQQSLVTDGWDSSATITKGTVFTIDAVFMVNPKTKVSTGILQQFTVLADVTADETTTNDTTLTISPPIITSGPHQTVNAAALNDATITLVGSASTGYKQNLVYHRNAMALAMVPMELPTGAVNPARRSRNGISVRVIPVYDGINDQNKWRLDVLYARKLIDPRLATRLSGTA